MIGVAGANHWARSGAAIFTTQDYDLFLPLDPAAELADSFERVDWITVAYPALFAATA